ADLPHALRNRIGHRKDLFCLLVEQQVVVAEMRSAHVPVKVLGLDVEREHVRERAVQRRGEITHRVRLQAGWLRFCRCFHRCVLQCPAYCSVLVLAAACFAASVMTSATFSGSCNIATWQVGSLTATPPARFAPSSSMAGCRVWSFVEITCQEGLFFQAA